ncbi:uncharacterized protein PRCAT00006282001 [Priceomyces carsonii]|uniref:uncharacterized protein n=1 Tax=Priceomyces carsonii TaxID=28549 RepID=UPI002ED917AA|nr:unnamed protein product [Priceomyces carsonii]
MSTTEYNFKEITDNLIAAYAKHCLALAQRVSISKLALKKFNSLQARDKPLIQQVLSISNCMDRYNDPVALDKVLDTIDLPKIYLAIDKRMSEDKNTKFAYEDYLVMELLHYFKRDFFKWITKPKCPVCHESGDNISSIGTAAPPAVNPDEISRIEKYSCSKCGTSIEFPRYNNASKLLDTRCGRCGEWVNCFLLILKSLLATNSRVRYVWNHEDHVWCEYYSTSLKRWVHLDPCEDAFDNPTLYCQNWGKKMSFVIGIGEGYVIDLSDKYITVPGKQIDKRTLISNARLVDTFITLINYEKLLRYYIEFIDIQPSPGHQKLLNLYYDIILMNNVEKLQISQRHPSPSTNSDMPKGRQTGGPEWTKNRGEDG